MLNHKLIMAFLATVAGGLFVWWLTRKMGASPNCLGTAASQCRILGKFRRKLNTTPVCPASTCAVPKCCNVRTKVLIGRKVYQAWQPNINPNLCGEAMYRPPVLTITDPITSPPIFVPLPVVPSGAL